MKKIQYIAPQTEVVVLRLSAPLTLDDLFTESQEEESKDPWVGAKENGGFFDEEPFGSLWDDEPVEDPFSIDDY